MRKSLFTLAILALFIGTAPVGATDVERMVQGGVSMYGYVAKERGSFNFNKRADGGNFTTLTFDHNPDMPDGDLFCYGAQLVSDGTRRHFTKYRVEAQLLTLEATYSLRRYNGTYQEEEFDDLIPGFDFLVPGFSDQHDLYMWSNAPTWDQTSDGIPFSEIYQTTQGSNVLFLNYYLNRGRESPDDYTTGFCGAYVGKEFLWQEEAKARVGEWVLGIALRESGKLQRRPDRE
jgi:hypothetical protein